MVNSEIQRRMPDEMRIVGAPSDGLRRLPDVGAVGSTRRNADMAQLSTMAVETHAGTYASRENVYERAERRRGVEVGKLLAALGSSSAALLNAAT
jgi:hypothetical protein